jgi:hypothetical protein
MFFRLPRNNYKPGDGIFISEGAGHKDRATVISEKVLVFFIETF